MKIEIRVSPDPIDAAQWATFHENPACGAEITFLGVVRNRNHGKNVRAVAYDAFVPLAETTLRQIGAEALAQWGRDTSILILHRTGTLEIGEASVLISVSTPHRDAAYACSRYVIEELKTRAPIWKKEFYDDGETEWLQGHALCGHAEETQA